MASTYPGTLDSFATTKQDDTDAASGSDLGLSTSVGDHATHHNDLADAVNKIEAELGTDPSGALATVKARLDKVSTVFKTADQNFSVTTLADVTDMFFPVVIGGYYSFEFFVIWSHGTAGIVQQHGITFPAVTGFCTWALESFSVNTVGTGGTDVAFQSVNSTSGTKTGGGGGTSIPATNEKTLTRVTGIMSNPSANGNIQLQAATETATTSTMFKGSFGRLHTL